MDEIVVAYIEVERVGWFQYEATIHHRPPRGDSPFTPLIMSRGPYCGFRHRSAWRKAWESAGQPVIVDFEDL